MIASSSVTRIVRSATEIRLHVPPAPSTGQHGGPEAAGVMEAAGVLEPIATGGAGPAGEESSPPPARGKPARGGGIPKVATPAGRKAQKHSGTVKPRKPSPQKSSSRKSSSRPSRKFPAEPLTQDEVRALLKSCSNKSATGIRNRALIVAFYRGGLRLKEALALLPKDIDLAQGTIRVLHGKGDKSRLVGVDPEAATVIQRWMDHRAKLGVSPRAPVFCTLKGGRVAPVYCRNLMRRLGKEAGITKRVHPHGLRHTHAFELAGEGVPIHVIQQQLGHSSLATTDRYIRHLNPQQVVEAMRGREWKECKRPADPVVSAYRAGVGRQPMV